MSSASPGQDQFLCAPTCIGAIGSSDMLNCLVSTPDFGSNAAEAQGRLMGDVTSVITTANDDSHSFVFRLLSK